MPHGNPDLTPGNTLVNERGMADYILHTNSQLSRRCNWFMWHHIVFTSNNVFILFPLFEPSPQHDNCYVLYDRFSLWKRKIQCKQLITPSFLYVAMPKLCKSLISFWSSHVSWGSKTTIYESWTYILTNVSLLWQCIKIHTTTNNGVT